VRSDWNVATINNRVIHQHLPEFGQQAGAGQADGCAWAGKEASE